jgi:hypothetical protein
MPIKTHFPVTRYITIRGWIMDILIFTSNQWTLTNFYEKFCEKRTIFGAYYKVTEWRGRIKQ